MKPLHRHNIFQVDEIITGNAKIVTLRGKKGQLEPGKRRKHIGFGKYERKIRLVRMTGAPFLIVISFMDRRFKINSPFFFIAFRNTYSLTSIVLYQLYSINRTFRTISHSIDKNDVSIIKF